MEGFSDPTSRFRVTIGAYAIAKSLAPLSYDIDFGWSGLGTTISCQLQRASGKTSREEIACPGAANRTAEE
jgi:hypothetical protein